MPRTPRSPVGRPKKQQSENAGGEKGACPLFFSCPHFFSLSTQLTQLSEPTAMIKCYLDESGSRRVDPQDLHPLIASFLEQDVQSSITSCDQYLQAIQSVCSGIVPEWIGIGNAHTLSIRRSEVTIENEWDDSFGIAHLSHSEMKKSLEMWREFNLN
jgi:uncharacterized protein YacL (UPF0231 family)